MGMKRPKSKALARGHAKRLAYPLVSNKRLHHTYQWLSVPRPARVTWWATSGPLRAYPSRTAKVPAGALRPIAGGEGAGVVALGPSLCVFVIFCHFWLSRWGTRHGARQTTAGPGPRNSPTLRCKSFSGVRRAHGASTDRTGLFLPMCFILRLNRGVLGHESVLSALRATLRD